MTTSYRIRYRVETLRHDLAGCVYWRSKVGMVPLEFELRGQLRAAEGWLR
jgi:hypothetical protein